MTYEVLCNGEHVFSGTLDQCMIFVNNQIEEEASELYDNGDIDKYGKEDILIGLEEELNKYYSFSHPELKNDWEIHQIKRVFSIGYTEQGNVDETQFETDKEDDTEVFIELFNLFLDFARENHLNHVYITHIEEVESGDFMLNIGDLIQNKETQEIAEVIYKIIDDSSYAIEFADGRRFHINLYDLKKYFKKVHAICPRCGHFLKPSDLDEYKFLCTNCDENFYGIEVSLYV